MDYAILLIINYGATWKPMFTGCLNEHVRLLCMKKIITVFCNSKLLFDNPLPYVSNCSKIITCMYYEWE